MAAHPIELNGRIYTFELGVDQYEQLEELFATKDRELSYLEILRKAMGGHARYFTRVMWIALRTHHPEMDLGAVRALIEATGGVLAFDAAVARLAADATPDPVDAAAVGTDTGNPRPARARRRPRPARRTGDRSISPPAVTA